MNIAALQVKLNYTSLLISNNVRCLCFNVMLMAAFWCDRFDSFELKFANTEQTNKQIISINYDKTFYRLGKIQPRDLKLSDVMATSAAALALYMGVYDVMAERVRNLQMVLGVHFGKSLISDPSRDVAGSTIPCCRVRSILLLSPLRQTHRQV